MNDKRLAVLATLTLLLLTIVYFATGEPDRNPAGHDPGREARWTDGPRLHLDADPEGTAAPPGRDPLRGVSAASGTGYPTIECVGPLGNPVVGATVFGLADHRERRLGLTGADGRLNADLARVTELSADGEHSTGALTMPPAGWAPVTRIELTRTLRVHGTVLNHAGEPIGGVHVLAYAEGQEPSRAAIEDALSSLSGGWLRHALTGGDGRFTLQLPASADTFVFRAAGAGHRVPRSRPERVHDGQVLTLLAERVFGVRVVLGTEEGSPGRAPKWCWAPPGPRWEGEVGTVMTGFSGTIEGRLLGLRWETMTSEWSGTIVIVVSSPSADAALGPLRVAGHPAGYRAFEVEVEIPALTGGELPSLRIPLEPVCTARASLEIVLRWPADGLNGGPSPSQGRPVAVVRLLGLDGQGSFELPLFTFFEESLVIEGVPSGRYDTDLRLPLSARSLAELEGGRTIDLPPDGRATLRFDLTRTASVALELDCRERPGYRSDFLFEVHAAGREGQAEMAVMGRAPYVLRGVLPGEYTLYAYRPFGQPVVRSFVVSEEDLGEVMTLEVAD
ncbi:MAG: carboxypeptidase-like regulatory domain-containing protein [Planctomycetota bacterium]|jgi:hypothetical protein|nr:carboxypeptidase-like regulatory domain-containing protein [Planctomycetota bacterium]